MGTETHEVSQGPTEADILTAYLELDDDERIDVLKDMAVLIDQKKTRRPMSWRPL